MKQAFEKEGIKGANSVDKTEQKVADLVKVGRSAAAKSQGASKGLKRKLEPEHKVLTETKNYLPIEHLQGGFFNCSHPKISKCQPVSKLRPILRTVPTLKKTKKEKV